jgi:HEXXH motif-containing protein
METIEDTLVLIRSCAPECFDQHGLARAAEQIHLSSESALSALQGDPKIGMWSLIDLTPLVENPGTASAFRLATEVADQLNYIALGIANYDRRPFATLVKPLPQGAFVPLCGKSFVWPHGDSERMMATTDCGGTISVNNIPLKFHRWHINSGFTLPYGDASLAPLALEGYNLSNFDRNALTKWDKLLSRIRPLIDHSDTRLLIASFGSFLLPLEESTDGNHLSVSFKDRPSIVYASWSQNPMDVFEAVVHEADHQCLYETINDGPLFADAPVNEEAVFRSPWRRDRRPLSGLFFGLSAFVTVGVAWTRLVENVGVDPEYGGRRAVLTSEQSLDAISIITNHAIMTDKGMGLLVHNKREALSSIARLQTHFGFDEWTRESQARRRADKHLWEQALNSARLVSA